MNSQKIETKKKRKINISEHIAHLELKKIIQMENNLTDISQNLNLFKVLSNSKQKKKRKVKIQPKQRKANETTQAKLMIDYRNDPKISNILKFCVTKWNKNYTC